MLDRIGVGKPLETIQHQLGPVIGVTQSAFEREKALYITGKCSEGDPAHRGTGNAIRLRRSVATRRYAEVESGSR
jgi:hypothetical protein